MSFLSPISSPLPHSFPSYSYLPISLSLLGSLFPSIHPSPAHPQIILMIYWFGYSLGYVVSQLVPIKHAALLGVVLLAGLGALIKLRE